MHLYPSSLDCPGFVEPGKPAVSIFAVIVLYKMYPDDSMSYQSLLEAIGCADDPTLKVSLLVADNTPGGQSVAGLPSGVRYEAFPDNPGLVVPYRRALAQAELEGFEWLLTLDQDTRLPPEFLSAFARYAGQYHADESVAAVVPRIYDNGRPISPFRYVGGFLPRLISSRVDGLLGLHASALNSASLLRISALNRAGGYDDNFPLNNSDTALFHRLDNAGFRIALAGDVIVQHELAIMSRSERMTVERYRQLLIDERNFWDLHMSAPARAERLIRLFGRWAKSYMRKEGVAFRRATFNEMWLRSFSSRAMRIRQEPNSGTVTKL